MLNYLNHDSRWFENKPRWVWLFDAPEPVEAESGGSETSETVTDGGKDPAAAKEEVGKQDKKARTKCKETTDGACREADEADAAVSGEPDSEPTDLDKAADEVAALADEAGAEDESATDEAGTDAEPGTDDSAAPEEADSTATDPDTAPEDEESEPTPTEGEGDDSPDDQPKDSGDKPSDGGSDAAETAEAEDYSRFEEMDEDERMDFVLNKLILNSNLKDKIFKIMDEEEFEGMDDFMGTLADADNAELKDSLQGFANSLTPEEMATIESGEMTDDIAQKFIDSAKEGYKVSEIGVADPEEKKYLSKFFDGVKNKIGGGKEVDALIENITDVLSVSFDIDENEEGVMTIEGSDGKEVLITSMEALLPFIPASMEEDFMAVFNGERIDHTSGSFKKLVEGFSDREEDLKTLKGIGEALNNFDVKGGSENPMDGAMRFLQLVGLLVSYLKAVNLTDPNNANSDMMNRAKLAINDWSEGREIGSTEKGLRGEYETKLEQDDPSLITLATIHQDPKKFQKENKKYEGEFPSLLADAAERRMADSMGMKGIYGFVQSPDAKFTQFTGEFYAEGQATISIEQTPEGEYMLSVTQPSPDSDNPEPIRFTPVKITDASGSTVGAKVRAILSGGAPEEENPETPGEDEPKTKEEEQRIAEAKSAAEKALAAIRRLIKIPGVKKSFEKNIDPDIQKLLNGDEQKAIEIATDVLLKVEDPKIVKTINEAKRVGLNTLNNEQKAALYNALLEVTGLDSKYQKMG